MVKLIGGGIPYFIQVLFAELYKAHKLRKITITPSVITRIYEEQVLGVNCKTYFQHYYERLKAYDKQYEKAAKLLLSRLSVVEGIPRSECKRLIAKETGLSSDEFQHLMADIENDFYVRYQEKEKTYAFASGILKDWWRRYYSY